MCGPITIQRLPMQREHRLFYICIAGIKSHEYSQNNTKQSIFNLPDNQNAGRVPYMHNLDTSGRK